MGNQYRRGDCGDSRGRDLGDLSKPVARDGLVQYEASKGLGANLSTDRNKQKVGLSPSNGPHLGNDVEPVVVLLTNEPNPEVGKKIVCQFVSQFSPTPVQCEEDTKELLSERRML